MRELDYRTINDFSRIVLCKPSNNQRSRENTAANLFARHFDAVFVINVETDTERKSNILQLDDLGCEYHYVTAYTPSDPKAARIVRDVQAGIAENSEWQKALRWSRYDPAMMCLQLSHILILNYCLFRGWNSCLILEDDFLIHRDIANVGAKSFAQLPEDWNIIWLGAKQDQRYPAEPYNFHWSIPNLFTWGTHAYGLKNCIGSVRDTFSSMRLPVDLQLTHKTYGAKKYVARPALIISTCDGRPIGGEKKISETYDLWRWDITQYQTKLNKRISIPVGTHGGPWTTGCAGVGAWNLFVKTLCTLNKDNSDNAPLFLDFADRNFSWGHDPRRPIKQPWLGVFHHPYDLPDHTYGAVKKLLLAPFFQAASKVCRKIFTLSAYLSEQLRRDKEIASRRILVRTFMHPTNLYEDVRPFDLNAFRENSAPMLVSLGGAFRKFITLDQIQCPYIKAWAFGMYPDYLRNMADEFKRANYTPNGKTNILGHLSYAEYNALLRTNIGFLDVIESSANNCVLDCLARNTPLIAARHPAIVEYLGPDYPLYFDTAVQAQKLAASMAAIEDAHQYLKEYDKSRFNFYTALRNVYAEL